MPGLADVHGTNSGDNKFPKQQCALSGTANSSESAWVFGVAQNIARTSLWSAGQCQVTWPSQRRELVTRVVIRILTLLEGQPEKGKTPAPDVGSRSLPVRGEPRERSWILLLCTFRFLVVFFSVDRGQGGTRAGHEDLEIPWRRTWTQENPDVLGRTVIAFCCVTCCGSSVSERIVIDVAA